MIQAILILLMMCSPAFAQFSNGGPFSNKTAVTDGTQSCAGTITVSAGSLSCASGSPVLTTGGGGGVASPWAQVDPNIYTITQADNVGIGTTMPTNKLDVEGTSPVAIDINGIVAGGTGGCDSYVSVLSHFDGANAGTTFTDENCNGSGAKTLYRQAGSASTSTTQKKFGATSLLLSDSGTDNLVTADSADFTLGSGNFTVDAWIFPTSLDGTNGTAIWGQADAAPTAGSRQAQAFILSTGKLEVAVWDNTATKFASGSSTTSIATNQWQHIAMVRNGNTVTGYINGVPECTIDVTGKTLQDATGLLGMGAIGSVGGLRFHGYVDEFRFSKGIARWTSNFSASLPSSAYSASASSPNSSINFYGNRALQFSAGSNGTTSTFDISNGLVGTNPRVSIKTDGNVGIATTTAMNKLDINGAEVIGSGYSGNYIAPTNGLLVQGNLGIGSTAPVQALDVNGTVRSSGFQLTTSPSAGYVLTSTSVGIGTWQPAAGGASQWTGTNPIYYMNNVGIGTSNAPAGKLDIKDTTNNATPFTVRCGLPMWQFTNSSTSNRLVFAGIDGSGNSNVQLDPLGISYFKGGNVGINTSAPNARLEVVGAGATSATASLNVHNSAQSQSLVVLDSGNVGINTSAPRMPLEVDGLLYATKIVAGSLTSTAYSIETNGTMKAANVRTGLLLSSGGGVSVGNNGGDPIMTFTESQNVLLTKGGGGTIGPYVYVGTGGAGAVDNELGFFIAGEGSTTNAQGPYWGARGNNFTRSSNQRGYLFFVAGDPTGSKVGLDGTISFLATNDITMSTPAGEMLHISQGGGVGINQPSPSYNLDVGGDVNITGTYRVNGVPISSFAPEYGDLDAQWGVSQPILLSGSPSATWYEITGGWTLQASSGISSPSGYGFRIATTGVYKIEYSIYIDMMVPGGEIFRGCLGINGIPSNIAPSQSSGYNRKDTTLVGSAIINLNAADEVTIWVENIDSNTDATFDAGTFTIQRVQ